MSTSVLVTAETYSFVSSPSPNTYLDNVPTSPDGISERGKELIGSEGEQLHPLVSDCIMTNKVQNSKWNSWQGFE